MGLTTDRNDDCLNEVREDGQQECYLILSDEERAKGFVRPVRRNYTHKVCGSVTTMGQALAETYARDPKFYGGTFCVSCGDHFKLNKYEDRLDEEVPNYVPQFFWDGTSEAVGS